ncbi:type II toxin-antitoxin system VapC family toxin [Mesorhizobium sp. CN2-181]|uniref:type II toxin-antitoxin system VapC family toxin n=1 Tax=Mesorhizobium yinganensis TaxID=3157707 RepID=UPI0032B8809C
MPVVIDSSVAACWLMPDEFSEVANSALEIVSAEGMLVPPLFWYELRNVLLVNERRGRIAPAQIEQGLMRIGDIPCMIDVSVVEHVLFSLARTFSLTVYDGAYLEIAVRTPSTLATLDRRLASAAKSAGVQVLSA